MNLEKILKWFRNILQICIAAIVVYSVFKVEKDLFINSFIPLIFSLIPEYLSRKYDHNMNIFVGLWISVAAFLHVVGAVGLYQRFGWYDSIAHSVSGALMAGVGYAIIDALDRFSEAVEFGSNFKFLFLFLFTLAIGTYWEILEFALAQLSGILGGEPALTQYGAEDIVNDILYNSLGGLLVGLFGTQLFEKLSTFLTQSDTTQEELK